jgi:hypothetical protein
VFLVYIDKNLPKEDVKVIIGDNLRAHLSPTVLNACRRNNIRYRTVPVPVRTIEQKSTVTVS